MNTEAQTKQILSHLRKGLTLTAREAIALFGCYRLAARIQDLRDAGHKIHTAFETGGGRRWGRYSLLSEAINE